MPLGRRDIDPRPGAQMVIRGVAVGHNVLNDSDDSVASRLRGATNVAVCASSCGLSLAISALSSSVVRSHEMHWADTGSETRWVARPLSVVDPRFGQARSRSWRGVLLLPLVCIPQRIRIRALTTGGFTWNARSWQYVGAGRRVHGAAEPRLLALRGAKARGVKGLAACGVRTH